MIWDYENNIFIGYCPICGDNGVAFNADGFIHIENWFAGKVNHHGTIL